MSEDWVALFFCMAVLGATELGSIVWELRKLRKALEKKED